MKAVLLERHGAPTVLRVRDHPAPEPAPGQVRVRVRRIGLNYAEVLSRKGLYGWAPRLPYVLGMEAFGSIDGVGAGVERRVGEPVIVGAQSGCYAEFVCVPSGQALPAMAGFSEDENAAFAVNFLTAWVALMELARVRPGERVLVQAAAGGVGTAAVQIAAAHGCTVYGALGADGKRALVERLGARATVNYRSEPLGARLRELTAGQGVDAVVELVGGEPYRQALSALAPLGRVAAVGFASLALQRWDPFSWWRTWRDLPRADLRDLSERSYGLLSSHLGFLLQQHPSSVQRLWGELRAFTATHDLRPVVGASFALQEVAAAHALMESRASTGKIVLRV